LFAGLRKDHLLWNNSSTSGANSYIRDSNQNMNNIPTAKKLLEQMKRTNSTIGSSQNYLKNATIKPTGKLSKDSSAMMMFDTSKNIND